MASKMILKCGKTGRLFFTTAAAEEHAEAFGKEYANFDEVSLDTKVWVCVETGRSAYTENDVGMMKKRDPDSKTWEVKDVAYLVEMQKKKDQVIARKEKFFSLVNQKKLTLMTETKSIGRTRAAKGLFYTKDKGTVEAAEAWIEEHSSDPDLDKLTEEFLESAFAAAGEPDVVMGDGDVVMEEPEERGVAGDPNPPEIKEKVNKELLKQLMDDMGFSELRAEKALYKTDGGGIEHAINWLAEHGEDADIDIPLAKPRAAPPPKPKMSTEEAAAKALELQNRIKARKAEEEKISEKEKERMRIESVKMMNDASVKLKEEEARRAIEQRKREEDEHAAHKAQLKEQLRQDYIDRFGKEPPAEAEEQKVTEKSSKDQMCYWLAQMKKNHKDTNAEGLKTCLSTLKIYIKNLSENPQEPKFKALKLDNKAFQSRIAPFPEAISFLDVMGFEKKEDRLEQRKGVPDGWLCSNAIKFLDLMVSQL